MTILNIPKDAKLSDIITIMNHMRLDADIAHKDPDFQTWLYEHKDWMMSGDE